MNQPVNNLELESIVKEETDFLIDQVNSLEGMLKRIIEDSKRDQFGNSQIRNLLQAARQASGIKEIMLYIQYQMARDEKRESWAKKHHNGQTLGEAVMDILHKIEQRIGGRNLPESDLFRHELAVRLMERFFLYWSWKYKYLRSQMEDTEAKNTRGHKRTNKQSYRHR